MWGKKDVNNVTRYKLDKKKTCRFIKSQFCKRFFFNVLEFMINQIKV